MEDLCTLLAYICTHSLFCIYKIYVYIKQYPKEELETYDKEEKILKRLLAKDYEGNTYKKLYPIIAGFPNLISSMKSENQAEMVLEVIIIR